MYAGIGYAITGTIQSALKDINRRIQEVGPKPKTLVEVYTESLHNWIDLNQHHKEAYLEAVNVAWRRRTESRMLRTAMYYLLVTDRPFINNLVHENKPYPLNRVTEVIDSLRRRTFKEAGNPRPLTAQDIGVTVYDTGDDGEAFYVTEDLLSSNTPNSLLPVMVSNDYKKLGAEVDAIQERIINEGIEQGFAVR